MFKKITILIALGFLAFYFIKPSKKNKNPLNTNHQTKNDQPLEVIMKPVSKETTSSPKNTLKKTNKPSAQENETVKKELFPNASHDTLKDITIILDRENDNFEFYQLKFKNISILRSNFQVDKKNEKIKKHFILNLNRKYSSFPSFDKDNIIQRLQRKHFSKLNTEHIHIERKLWFPINFNELKASLEIEIKDNQNEHFFVIINLDDLSILKKYHKKRH